MDAWINDAEYDFNLRHMQFYMRVQVNASCFLGTQYVSGLRMVFW